MSPAPPRVYLHIGLHKTGTTYLQNLLAANQQQLRANGVDYPGGRDEPVQAFAALDLQGRRPRGYNDKRVEGSWEGLVTAIHARGLPTALVSDERLSMSTLKQVRRAVDSFPHSEVHVVVTVRDLGRIAVSAWQEDVKSDETWTWQQFAAAIKDPQQIAKAPARGFWLRQDIPKICETWEAAVGASHVHVVIGAPVGLVTRRAGQAVRVGGGLRCRCACRARLLDERDRRRGRDRGDSPRQRAARGSAQPA
ncbi:MAG: hypothetical protein WKF76_06280 [Nocardioidaceae bacterium]